MSIPGYVIKGGVRYTLPLVNTPQLYAVYSSTANAAAVANAINYTPPAAAGIWRITWEIDATTSTTDSFHLVATWRGATGDALSQTLGGSDSAGTALAAGAITNMIGNGAYYGSITFAVDSSGTAITLSTAGTFTTVAYNFAATLERLK